MLKAKTENERLGRVQKENILNATFLSFTRTFVLSNNKSHAATTATIQNVTEPDICLWIKEVLEGRDKSFWGDTHVEVVTEFSTSFHRQCQQRVKSCPTRWCENFKGKDILGYVLKQKFFYCRGTKEGQMIFFYISEYEITQSLAPWNRTQSMNYLVVGSQRVKLNI